MRLTKESKVFLVVLTSLFFLSSAFSWTYETDQEFSICRGESKEIKVKVTNEEGSKISLDVKKSGTASSWSVIANSLPFELENGETKNLNLFIWPTKSVEPGDYNLKLEIGGKEIDFEIHVGYCHSLKFSKSKKAETCLLEPISYKYNLTNTGRYDEEVVLNLKGEGKELVTLNKDSLRLQPGETKSITAFFYPTKEPGNYSITLEAVSQTSETNTFVGLEADVRRCSDYELSGPEETSVCEGESKMKAFEIKNIGNRDDEYQLEVLDPKWASLTKEKIELETGETDVFFLNITPPCGKVGRKSIEFRVEAKNALKNITYELPTTIRDCYSGQIEFNRSQVLMCEGENRSFNLLFENTGERRLDCSLKSEGIGDLNEYELSLDPGEKEGVQLNIKEKPGNYTVVSKASCKNECTVKDQDSLGIEVRSFKGCRKPSLDLKNSYEFKGGELLKINFALENTGIRKTNYSLSFSGSASTWIAGTAKSVFELKPGESESTSIVLTPPENSTGSSLEIEVYSQNKLVGRKSITLEPEIGSSGITSRAISELKGQIKFYWALILGLIASLGITWLKILKE